MAAVRPYGAVFAIAAVTRLAVTYRHGVFGVDTGYDAAVYFSGSDALLHGRLPYSGFVLLHPPGLTLALTPFAALTYVLPDWLAYGIATIAFGLLGAINAVLVVRLARRCGLTLAAAVAGGVFYAVWFGAVGAEHVTKLEPLGNFLLLVALLFATEVRRRPDAVRPALFAGAALGLAVSVKIWWVVPLALIIAWLGLMTRRRIVVARLLGGAALAALVVNLPFFLAAPRAMWTSVIVDQLGRPVSAIGPLQRLGDLTTLPRLASGAGPQVVVLGSCVAGALFAIAAIRAAGRPVGRAALALLGAQLAVLLLAPSWFPYYCDYLAVPAALTIAAAAHPLQRRTAALVAWLPVAAAGTVTALVVGMATAVPSPFHGAETLTRAVAHVRCVMSDSPMALIELDALSRGLSAGCPDWIDDTGPTYGRDRSSHKRTHNQRWQRDATRYLRAGGAVILLRGKRSGLDRHTRHEITRNGLLDAVDGHRVYRVIR
jgi:uncharacterized membrane protein